MKTSNARSIETNYLKLILLLLIITFLSISTATQAKGKRYPGKLIDIGTHRLHIHCVGSGSPSVIIDSGIGGFSLEWLKVQDNLSKSVRVCSYDRAGYGWSDPGPRPRTTDRITYELHNLLSESDIPGPYLFVGHSFGGYNIRYFASKYPELTAGLILIDSSHPEQFNTEEFKRVTKSQPKKNYKNSYTVRIIHPTISDHYPPENKRIASRLMSTMKSRSTLLNEMEYMEISAQQVARQTNHPPYIFPVTILTRGQRVWADDELGEQREMQWLRLQKDLENISMQSKHYLAKESGHIIHLDQPEFVSKKIMTTILEIRSQFYKHNLSKNFHRHLAPYLTASAYQTIESLFPSNTNIWNENSATFIPARRIPSRNINAEPLSTMSTLP